MRIGERINEQHKNYISSEYKSNWIALGLMLDKIPNGPGDEPFHVWGLGFYDEVGMRSWIGHLGGYEMLVPY